MGRFAFTEKAGRFEGGIVNQGVGSVVELPDVVAAPLIERGVLVDLSAPKDAKKRAKVRDE